MTGGNKVAGQLRNECPATNISTQKESLPLPLEMRPYLRSEMDEEEGRSMERRSIP